MRQLFQHPIAKHPLVYVAALLFIAIIVVIPIVAFANTPTFTEYPLTPATAHPAYIVTGPDGNIWFTEMENNKVGYINPTSRQITEYNLPLNGGSPYYNNPTGLTKGPDGNMWYTDEFTEKVSKITTSGVVTDYSLPNGAIQPDGIVTGPDGNLWVTLYGSNTIDVMNTSGTVIHVYPVTGGPEGISVGPDNNIWFAEQNTNTIVKMNPSNGAVTNYSAPSSTTDTAPGPDGNEWFTMSGSTKIGKIIPSSGTISFYTLPTSTGYVASFVTPGPDGNEWFSLSYVGIGVVNIANGTVTTYTSPSASTGGAWGITTGPDKNIWYTLNNNYSKIGVANLGLGGSSSSGSGSGGSTSGSGSGGSSGGGTGSNGSGGSGSPGTVCPTQPSQANSASECSAEAPGHNKLVGPTTSTTLPSGVVIVADTKGDSTATVASNQNLSNQTYSVPNNQTLYVDGKLGKTVVNKGAIIKGDGAVNDLIVDKGGVLSPGHSPGCLSTNALTILGTNDTQLDGTTACKSYDQVNSVGTITLGGDLTIELANSFHPQIGQKFTILHNASNKPIVGTFADLPEGSITLINNIPEMISYKGGAGNDITLTTLSKDAYLSSLTSHKNQSIAQPGELHDFATFVRSNASAVLGSLVAALAVVIGIIYLLIRKHNKLSVSTQPPADINSPVTPSTPMQS